MRKILVLRGGALGDFLITLPALATLRRAWPDARIELAGNATAAGVARPTHLLDAVHSQHEARWSALFNAAPLPIELAGWLGAFDLVVNFWPDESGELGRHFPIRPGQTFLSAPAQPACAPAAAHFCAALAPLGLAPAEFAFSLLPPRDGAPGSDGFIAIHPGSGSARKNWPLPRWTTLCEWLRAAHDAELLVITGEAEPPEAQALARFGTSAHQLPLDALVAGLAQCRLFIGHDSGVSHLAAACGVPCVLLFGPTDPAMWAPPYPRIRVIQRGADPAAIGLEQVRAEIADLLLAAG